MSSLAAASSSAQSLIPALSYAAPCSLLISAGLAIIVSSVDLPAAPNPFHFNFIQRLSAISGQLHPGADMFGTDPRNYSYLTLALYRLLRHLIPHTDVVVAAAEHSTSHAPPSSPASMQTAPAAISARVRELFTGDLQQHALQECEKCSRNLSQRLILTEAEVVQPLLTVDATLDERELSAWQRWLVSGTEWQRLAGSALEYFAAETIELQGQEMRQHGFVDDALSEEDDEEDDFGHRRRRVDTVLLFPIACMHLAVAGDEELMSLWRTIGMPEESPVRVDGKRRAASDAEVSIPEPADSEDSITEAADSAQAIDTDIHATYKRQFEQQMKTAVAVSAPWMFDAQQVDQRVSQWATGRLPSGDAVFFRRFHIRPLWHSGVDVSDFGAEEAQQGRDSDSHRHSFFPMKAGFDIMDAAGVSRTLVVKCSVQVNYKGRRQRKLDVVVSEKRGRVLLWCDDAVDSKQRPSDQSRRYTTAALYFVDGVLVPGREQQPPHLFADYLCHGHLHGLSEQQWDKAMGGPLRVDYQTDTGIKQELADDEQAAQSKAGMFPTRLADVVDRERYRHLQRTEIRRMAAIATRLAMLDAGVDAALFPPFQPPEMRRKFEAVARSRLETGVAQLPDALPAVLQEMVADYEPTQVDIPL